MKFLRIISVVLLICWMFLIFSLSSQNAKISSETSGNIIATIIHIFVNDFDSMTDTAQHELISSLQFFVRKSAHFMAYAVLGIFSFFTYITYTKIPFKFRLIIIPATCLMFSISDEIHQLFVPGRSAEIRDVCIDFCGSLLSIGILTLIARTNKFKKYI